MGANGRAILLLSAVLLSTNCQDEGPPSLASAEGSGGATEGEVPPKPVAKADGPPSKPSDAGPTVDEIVDASVDAGPADEPEVAKKAKKKRVKAPRIRSSNPYGCHAPDKEYIRRIVHRHMNEVHFCYERQLAQKPDLQGRVAVQFTIAGTGAEKKSKVVNSTVNDKKVEDCIANAVRRWTFPQPCDGEETTVTYPFQLNPPEG